MDAGNLSQRILGEVAASDVVDRVHHSAGAGGGYGCLDLTARPLVRGGLPGRRLPAGEHLSAWVVPVP